MKNKISMPIEPNIVEQKFEKVLSEKDSSIALFALVEALSYEVLSGDVWWLANHHARKLAVEKYGISEESYDAVMAKIDVARKAKSKTNPMSSMF
ncbi:hypothetical protein GW796_09650 [archaeon]|nr:hypothetical protein [archaeon]